MHWLHLPVTSLKGIGAAVVMAGPMQASLSQMQHILAQVDTLAQGVARRVSTLEAQVAQMTEMWQQHAALQAQRHVRDQQEAADRQHVLDLMRQLVAGVEQLVSTRVSP